ncbi:MAG: FAD-dependent oxidoreductase [Thalassobaculales bacterium]
MADNALFTPDFRERPYWWDAAPPPPPSLPDLPDRVEVAVIGGGYTGLNCALELRRAGIGVAVFEAERFGFGASSRNGGMVSGGLKLSSLDLARTIGPEKAARIVEESAGSLPFLEDLLAREGIDCHYARVGRFVGAHSPGAYRGLFARAELLARITGMPAEVLPRARQREENGTDWYHGGMKAAATGGLHPGLYHQGLAAAAGRAGALLVDGTPVAAVAREGDGFRLATPRGEVVARQVVAATNGYTGGATPWLRRRLVPVASYIIATEPQDPALLKKLVPNGRMLSDTKRVLNYYRLSPDGSRVIFGGRASFRNVGAREAAPTLHAHMTMIWPELAGARISHAWNGNVAFTFDHTPHLGVQDGIHYAVGCQGSGVAMMSYLGYRLARKLAGGANEPASAFDGNPYPTLPLYGGRPWFLPLVGTAYRLRDWLDRRAA